MNSSSSGPVSRSSPPPLTLFVEQTLSSEKSSDEPLTSQTILLCSALSKMTASVATYPHEVVRTRLQTQRRPLADDMSSDGMIKRHDGRGIISTTKNLILKEGWTGLYRGLSINLLRTVPNSAVTMLTCVIYSWRSHPCLSLPSNRYELLMRHLSSRTP